MRSPEKCPYDGTKLVELLTNKRGSKTCPRCLGTFGEIKP